MNDAPRSVADELSAPAGPAHPDDFQSMQGTPRPCGLADPMPVFVFHVLDAQRDVLRQEIEAARARGVTVDGVHRMRTSCRRIRALLRTFHELLPADAADPLLSEFAWFARELGRVRDLDVQIAGLQQFVEDDPELRREAAPYLEQLASEQSDARAVLNRLLIGERLVRLESDFAAFLDLGPTPAVLRRWARPSLRDGAAAYAEQALRRVRKLGKRAGRKAPPERMHKLRIRCKRLRYLLESFEPFFGDGLEPAIRCTRRLQDTLGEIQDSSAAVERLVAQLDAMPGGPGGRGPSRSALVAMQRTEQLRVEHARRRFRKAWRCFDDKVGARELRRLLS
jgi:CHAD domain-containing protein